MIVLRNDRPFPYKNEVISFGATSSRFTRAMKASAEIRTMLDARDANLQSLIAQLEEAVAVHSGKTSSDKKKAESVTVEPTQATSETPDYSRILP